MAVLPYGDRALLVELDDLDAVLALDASLRREPLPGVVDVVPAARTVLLRVDAGVDLARIRHRVEALTTHPAPPVVVEGVPAEAGLVDAVPAEAGLVDAGLAEAGLAEAGQDVVEVPTVYDGPDLAAVAAGLGLSPGELVQAHTGQEWTVAFCGFAPGFAYLTGPDERLASVPRLATPRTRVPAGSVALAGGFSAVYPSASPGGWSLLGRTDLRVFDVDGDPPARLRPGGRVRFVGR